MTSITDKDFTPGGLKIEGAYENDRNTKNRELFKAMIREAYGAEDVIIAHHLTYVAHETRVENGHEFTYEIVEEIPSADTLIFDPVAAKIIWGDGWRDMLTAVAVMGTEERDNFIREAFYRRSTD